MKKIWYYTFILFTLFLAGCEDTDKLEADINSLKERVAALESKVEMLNGNIKALNILCQDGMIISDVEQDAEKGVYTLTLSDGTKLKLAERTDGFANVPLVNISDEGYWQVSYDNGRTYTPILQGNLPMNAVAKDGYTPKFKINAAENWEVSTDGGSTYTEVLDANNSPVKAVFDASSSTVKYFKSVQVGETALTITFQDNKVVEVPIVSGFECYFDPAIQGEQKINPGETADFNVHISGVDKTIITTPMGWKATLGTTDAQNVAKLTVTAPQGKVVTRAVADNTRDIAILAFKGTFATLTKIQVNPIEVVTGGGDEPAPSGPITELNVPLTATTSFTSIVKHTASAVDTHLSGDTDFWFHRQTDDVTTVSIDVAESAVKAIVAGTKGSWNNSSFGFHSTGTFDRTQKYKLTFQAKSDVTGSVGVGIRTSDDTRGFRLIKADGITNWERNVTTPTTTTGWGEISLIFGFGYASENMTSGADTYNAKEAPTTDADVKGINIYLYNNKENTTLYVKDIKLVKL